MLGQATTLLVHPWATLAQLASSKRYQVLFVATPPSLPHDSPPVPHAPKTAMRKALLSFNASSMVGVPVPLVFLFGSCGNLMRYQSSWPRAGRERMSLKTSAPLDCVPIWIGALHITEVAFTQVDPHPTLPAPQLVQVPFEQI